MKNLIFLNEHDESYCKPKSKIRKKIAEDLIGKQLTF